MSDFTNCCLCWRKFRGPGRYCREECERRADLPEAKEFVPSKPRKTRSCEWCSKQFYSRLKTTRTCSASCRAFVKNKDRGLYS